MMTRHLKLALMGLSYFVFGLVLVFPAAAHQSTPHQHHRLVPIPEYAPFHGVASGQSALEAMSQFIASVETKTKASFMLEFSSDQRFKWSNLPAGIVERTGISVGELSDDQRMLLFQALSSSLSERGYQIIADVMAAETFLSGDKRAKRLKWSPENYWFSLYGTPSPDSI